ncbi:restriction endonuclease subunit S [Lactiplantibacillus argentoratensis]|uniref:restriction endonuclease subunit S n=1 Tax=Lactiplantibacillus argentoratensis TaxID=271881 RepID=UPI00073AFFDA|nr:restriction endonuclease subunit S [Lactiplantibacillus argentoratensis]KTF01127.1 Type I restriction-modification system specificity subunit S [Lactiplantibacillus plantarum]KZT81433.1 Type I restriction-modification system specificity subunit S [Lactiplantibacillus plantarum]MCT4444476.1 restriction endonuclease subunit S [Lactiplantibacillus argentoratensis]
MKNENLVPKVRFKGFSDPWEQRKWADLIDISTDMVDPRDVEFSELPHVGPGNIEAFSGQLLDNVNTVEKDHLISGKFHFYKGNIIYGKINPQLAKYIWADFEGLSSADTYVLTTKSANILNQGFIFYLLQTRNFYKYSVSVSMRTGMPKINRSELDAYSFLCPQSPEQIKIVQTIKILDDLIAANEDKLEQLKTLKKLMMQKIFSQKWRFKGFTDPWEQRKLKWFLRVSKLKNIDGIFDKNSVLSVSGEFGVVNQIAFQGRSFAGKSILNYGILDHNDVVYTKSPLKSNPYGIIKTNLGKAGVVSTLYAVYAPLKTVYSPILGYYFNLDTRVNNYLRPLVNKGAKNDMKVRDEAVLEGKVCIPDSIETQKRICNLFSLIDNLIAANEDKLNQLKKLKKYLMQNMFV